ncbi:Rossmann-like and DUF2520 domain-containing protein [Christiangramia aquimixticola]|uniref:Rossmann-like and DUF2520 domain-containing protein n=1 Tax=Christiangramia aquimixticola TaxID=1697558 RepID=UPI003AA80D98
MIKVVIIGAGNVAGHLYQSFKKTEQINVIQVFNRNIDKIDFTDRSTRKSSNFDEIEDAALYILAVKDEAIPEVANNLTSKNGLVVHTSGSVTLDSLSKFENHGVFYPLQSFSKNKPVDFSGIPICIEANSEKNLGLLKEVASFLSKKVFEVNSDQRKALHLSAVFVNNFSNHLFTIAADYCREHDLPFEILQPLIRETVSKIDSLPPFSAQTGPALRNDQKTIDEHLSMLDGDRKKIYELITHSIQNLHGKKL